MKADLGNVGLSLQKSDMLWKQAASKFSEMSKRIGQLEEVCSQGRIHHLKQMM